MLQGIKTAICVCATLILVGVVCVGTSVSATPQESATVTVKMTKDHLFVPDKITIKAGQTVEWVNEEEGGLHEVTDDADVASDPGDVELPKGAMPFDSKIIKTGKSFKYQFTVPGHYRYACPPHEISGMVGEVTVTK